MEKSSLRVHAKPSAIRLTERYDYKIVVANNPVKELTIPMSNIEIIVPYDGEQYFNSQTLSDIERQIQNTWEQEQLNAYFGFLGFTNYGTTDLKERIEKELVSQNFLPLEIMIQNQEHSFQGREVVQNDCHACRITYTYKAEKPEDYPIDVKVNIYDEESIRYTEHGSLAESREGSPEKNKEFADIIVKRPSFKGELFIECQISLKLPGSIADDEEEELPLLGNEHTYKSKFAPRDKNIAAIKSIKRNPYPEKFTAKLSNISFEWPISSVSEELSHQVELTLNGKRNHPILYHPSEGVITWSDIHFDPVDERTKGMGLRTFQTPKMLLCVKQPGEIYHSDKLNGKFEIQISRTCSNMHCYYFNIEGEQKSHDPKIQVKTIISTDMTIHLGDRFKQRIFSPFHLLDFEGVFLEEGCINEIVSSLEDQGFDVPIKTENISLDLIKKQHLLIGKKAEGRSTLTVFMVIEGKHFQVTRSVQHTERQAETAPKEAGSMKIYMRGQLEGNSPSLFKTLNIIQSSIKERLRHRIETV